jgi:hypothetical protein
MRDFANSSIRFNKKMPDEDKLVYGIHPADTTPTHHGMSASQPGTAVENTRNHKTSCVLSLMPRMYHESFYALSVAEGLYCARRCVYKELCAMRPDIL